MYSIKKPDLWYRKDQTSTRFPEPVVSHPLWSVFYKILFFRHQLLIWEAKTVATTWIDSRLEERLRVVPGDNDLKKIKNTVEISCRLSLVTADLLKTFPNLLFERSKRSLRSSEFLCFSWGVPVAPCARPQVMFGQCFRTLISSKTTPRWSLVTRRTLVHRRTSIAGPAQNLQNTPDKISGEVLSNFGAKFRLKDASILKLLRGLIENIKILNNP